MDGMECVCSMYLGMVKDVVDLRGNNINNSAVIRGNRRYLTNLSAAKIRYGTYVAMTTRSGKVHTTPIADGTRPNADTNYDRMGVPDPHMIDVVECEHNKRKLNLRHNYRSYKNLSNMEWCGVF